MIYFSNSKCLLKGQSQHNPEAMEHLCGVGFNTPTNTLKIAHFFCVKKCVEELCEKIV